MAETQTYEPRLKADYRQRIRPALKEKFGYTNEMQIPRLDKIVVNMGIGEAVADSKKAAVGDEGSGRDHRPEAACRPRPAPSIASFKLREGMVVGAKVTLRKDRMYEFLDRLITIALPRVKDFRGLKPTSFDGRGNYALGLREHIVFPEINYDEIDQIWGMDIIVCTTAETDDEARALLQRIPVPVQRLEHERGERTDMAKKSAVNRNEMVKRLVKTKARQARRAEGDRQRTRTCRWRSASTRA